MRLDPKKGAERGGGGGDVKETQPKSGHNIHPDCQCKCPLCRYGTHSNNRTKEFPSQAVGEEKVADAGGGAGNISPPPTVRVCLKGGKSLGCGQSRPSQYSSSTSVKKGKKGTDEIPPFAVSRGNCGKTETGTANHHHDVE
jgi:hypothetical protein